MVRHRPTGHDRLRMHAGEGTTMRIGYANLYVSDLERAMAFYGDLLGLELQHADREFGYASYAAGAIRLGLAAVGTAQADLYGRHSGIGFCVDDLAAEHQRLAAAGVAFPMLPQKQPWGGFMALMADPDGNVHYLDEVPEDHDRAL